MRRVFADTFYYLALLNEADAAHRRAVEFSRAFDGQMVTTAWVLTELADGLAQPDNRPVFLRLWRALNGDPDVTIVPADSSWFEAGVRLYEQRPDKAWTLTDCISFAVMERERILEAATGDRHFEQAGFEALLRSPSG